MKLLIINPGSTSTKLALYDGAKKLLQENLKKTRVHTDELTEYLRIQGVTDLTQVQYAILETSGAISTFLYPKYEPAPAKDAGIRVQERKLPVTVIV